MSLLIDLPLLLLFFVVCVVVRQIPSRSISHLPGPDPGPWVIGNIIYSLNMESGLNYTTGNLPELLRPENVGEAELAWIEKYGTAINLKSRQHLGCTLFDIFSLPPVAIEEGRPLLFLADCGPYCKSSFCAQLTTT
ncbi:hypothetical protein JB92DRAFT_2834428 [Gautieria morchelliformis]|nr:hypothetical protein JB92DRAFT_2834428 [Gautieria morchelliformis]